MATIRSILVEKGDAVQTVGPGASVLDAAVIMNEHKIGSLLVIDQGRLVGIITERDVLRRVVADRKDPAAAEVSSIMTTKLTCGRLDMPVGEAREIMRSRRIRHLPIVEDDGTVLGMISIGDLNAHQLDGQQQTIQYMHEYLYGGAS